MVESSSEAEAGEAREGFPTKPRFEVGFVGLAGLEFVGKTGGFSGS